MKELIPAFSFASKWILWFIPPVVLLLVIIWWAYTRKKNSVSFNVSDSESFTKFKRTRKGKIREGLPLLKILSVVFLMIALARPQTTSSNQKVSSDGIDIVISMDVSTSMLAQDFKPNRLESAKKEAMTFIEGRKQDRIGLVIFAGESFTQCPVTINHTVLQNQIKQIKNGLLEDGTAIGMGLATAVQRLKESEAKSKVVILMTDGVNNRGLIDPATASEIASSFNVRVYTIGVGNNGLAYTPVGMMPNGQLVFQNAEVQIDEKLLREVAEKTGGKYFRANNNKKLKDIYSEIDKLEKTKIEVSSMERKEEKFLIFALIGFGLFLLEFLLKNTILKSLS